MLTINEVPLSKVGQIDIIPYSLDHFKELVVRPHEEEIKESVLLSDTEWAKAIGKEAIEAYTGYIDGNVFAIGGLNILWKGVGEVWVIGSPTIPSQRFSYVKIVKFYLKYFQEKYKLRRVQAQVIEEHDMLHRFVKHMGFTYEGTLHNYCGGNMNNCMYAIWENK